MLVTCKRNNTTFASDIAWTSSSKSLPHVPCVPHAACPTTALMNEATYFPHRLILAGAVAAGVLLALAMHMLGARFGLDLGGLWRNDADVFMPAGSAVAWWLIVFVGFFGGFFFATFLFCVVLGLF